MNISFAAIIIISARLIHYSKQQIGFWQSNSDGLQSEFIQNTHNLK